VIGDLNAYALEDAITAFTRAGYEDLLNAFEGDSAYTFVFDGQWGYLDHALANRSLTPQVTGATIWHINADEVNLLDYNDTVEDPAERSFEVKPLATELYAPDAYRSSDHDPVIVGLALGEQPGNKDACKNGGWQALLREDGTRFRNQGLCIKYVNTGR
jgi:predicted extracellular nuclease